MLEEKFVSILNEYEGNGFYQAPNIPSKKLKKAVKHYPVAKGENVLALVDATIMGSAKCGLAIGMSGIYWANSWTTATKKQFLTWSELGSDAALFNIEEYSIEFLPGCAFGTATCSMEKEKLVEIIKRMSTTYQETDPSERAPVATVNEVSIVAGESSGLAEQVVSRIAAGKTTPKDLKLIEALLQAYERDEMMLPPAVNKRLAVLVAAIDALDDVFEDMEEVADYSDSVESESGTERDGSFFDFFGDAGDGGDSGD